MSFGFDFILSERSVPGNIVTGVSRVCHRHPCLLLQHTGQQNVGKVLFLTVNLTEWLYTIGQNTIDYRRICDLPSLI